MAVRVRQTYIQHQPELPEQQHEQVREQSPSLKKRLSFYAGEKFLFIIFAVVVASFAISIVHTQGEIQTVSMEIQTIEREITEVNNNNVDLKVRVSELSTHERIWEKAKELGLTLNEKNVKVVPGNEKEKISLPVGSLSNVFIIWRALFTVILAFCIDTGNRNSQRTRASDRSPIEV